MEIIISNCKVAGLLQGGAEWDVRTARLCSLPFSGTQMGGEGR